MSSLKPCPFCGGNEVFINANKGRYGWYVFVRCSICGAESKKLGLGEKYNDYGVDELRNEEKVLFDCNTLRDRWNMRASQEEGDD